MSVQPESLSGANPQLPQWLQERIADISANHEVQERKTRIMEGLRAGTYQGKTITAEERSELDRL
jgi:hypothetical protein